MADSETLHPPRLAPIFANTPSAPGTPVHSIQTIRRKSAGHSGPLTKILVANRGVSIISIPDLIISPISNIIGSCIHTHRAYTHCRKSPSVFSVLPMNWQCTQSRFTPLRIACLPIVKRSVTSALDVVKTRYLTRSPFIN
jgi:hypothetical protein